VAALAAQALELMEVGFHREADLHFVELGRARPSFSAWSQHFGDVEA
jgi:hypothetical protein